MPESLSVAEASQKLGVSIPTVKAMHRRGQLGGFRTAGGHLRIPVESLEAVRASNGNTNTSSGPAPSTTLKTRRERIEFLNLEGEEIRAKRALDRLRDEDAEEQEQRAAEIRSQDIEREERLEAARAERMRQERLQRDAAAQQLRARLRQQVQLALSIAAQGDLPPERHRELADAIDAELQRANVEDPDMATPIIKAVCQRFTRSLVAEATDRRTRERIIASARSDIYCMRNSTSEEATQAAAAARAAVSSIARNAPESELRDAVTAAVAPIRIAIEERSRQQSQRKETIELGVREVQSYLERLKRAAESNSITFLRAISKTQFECGWRGSSRLSRPTSGAA